MPTPPKPMLACGADLSKIKYPVYVQPKLDGVRALVKDGVVWSRTGKPIPNKHVQEQFRLLSSFDGELVVGEPGAPDVWNVTSSGVMKKDGKPNVAFYIFDFHSTPDTFESRLAALNNPGMNDPADLVRVVPTTLVKNEAELLVAEEHYTSKGYEGLIIRATEGPYKPGRSTQKEGYLLKLKRFQDAEGIVIGYGERMHNGNPATKDAFGRTKRSSAKAGKVGRGDLGFLVLRDPVTKECFEVGTGFTDEQREELWGSKHLAGLAATIRTSLLGRTVTYKYQKKSPAGIPIFPVFKGFRSTLDF